VPGDTTKVVSVRVPSSEPLTVTTAPPGSDLITSVPDCEGIWDSEPCEARTPDPAIKVSQHLRTCISGLLTQVVGCEVGKEESGGQQRQ